MRTRYVDVQDKDGEWHRILVHSASNEGTTAAPNWYIEGTFVESRFHGATYFKQNLDGIKHVSLLVSCNECGAVVGVEEKEFTDPRRITWCADCYERQLGGVEADELC